jgi:hypothetical protein
LYRRDQQRLEQEICGFMRALLISDGIGEVFQRLQANAFEVIVIKGGVRCMSVAQHRYAGVDLYLARWAHMLGARELRRPARGLHRATS